MLAHCYRAALYGNHFTTSPNVFDTYLCADLVSASPDVHTRVRGVRPPRGRYVRVELHKFNHAAFTFCFFFRCL